MATKLWAALLVLFTTLLTSSAQLLYKYSVGTLQFNIISIVTNKFLIGGMILYAIGGILMIVSFRGGELSVLYPIIATSYIWVSFLSMWFLHEGMDVLKWMGIASIIAGIVFIGFGSKDSAPDAV